MRTRIAVGLLAALAVGGLPEATAAVAGPQQLNVEVVATLPHDTAAFTQGLEFAGSILYESTGGFGQSSVTAGSPGKAPGVRARLAPTMYGEGITIVGPTLWQLTWRDGVAIARDPKTLVEQRRVPYVGEGWGLCHQANGRLVMSNGSSRLTFRDPRTFAVVGGVDVGVEWLNELECVGNQVYANVFGTDAVYRIDSATGRVTGIVRTARLRAYLPQMDRLSVLNGIAAIPGTDQFLLTGKRWPTMFRVRFVPTGA